MGSVTSVSVAGSEESASGFEHPWAQSHDGPSEKLGEIKRSSGKPLNVEARCVNLRNFKDPEATLITCSYSGDNPIDAPIYTSFGMMAHVARIRVDKFSSEAVKYSKTPSPKLVDMKLKPSSGSRFKQLWLMQFNREPGIVDLDTLTAAYGLLAENASSMGGSEKTNIYLPVIGFSTEQKIHLRGVIEEAFAFAFACSTTLADSKLDSVVFLLPTPESFKTFRTMFQKHTKYIQQLLTESPLSNGVFDFRQSLRMTINRMSEWTEMNAKEKNTQSLREALGSILVAYKDVADPAKSDAKTVNQQFGPAVAQSCLGVVKGFVNQFAKLVAIEKASTLKEKIVMLRNARVGRKVAGGRVVDREESVSASQPESSKNFDAENDLGRETSVSVSVSGRNRERTFINSHQYEDAEVIRRIGEKASLGFVGTGLDAALALQAINRLLSSNYIPSEDG